MVLIILCTPQQLQAMVLIILYTPPAAASNGAIQYYALHQQLQAMVLYNTIHSTEDASKGAADFAGVGCNKYSSGDCGFE